MRFNELNVPQGATITNAYIQFQVDESSKESTNLIIQGEASNNAVTFSTTNNNISSRPKTTASVNWSPKPWSTVKERGVDQRTPDISSIVQEIVDRENWVSGNSLVTIVTGSGERIAESFEGDSSAAPSLHVEYSMTDDGILSLEDNATSSLSKDEEGRISSEVPVTEPLEFETIYVSSSSNGSVDGISFQDEDILAFDSVNQTWSLYLDGSDIGLGVSDADINAFHLNSDGSILLSVNQTVTLPDVGSIDQNDIVRFVPTATGSNTSGIYEWYLNGSDVGLTGSSEDIDAISAIADDSLLISTKGSVDVTGISAKDEDLLVFTPNTLGESSSGNWELYSDSSDVGLGNTSSEDINATWINSNGEIYFSTDGAFKVQGVSGDSADVISFSPSSLGSNTSGIFNLLWNGSENGFAGEKLDGLSVI